MEIKDAVTATNIARQSINSRIFQPLSAKKYKSHWIVKANIGILDNVIVTIKLPLKPLVNLWS